jgi:circadian clock protein KaiC
MEESPQQIIRNMRSVGLDLKKWVDKKLLSFRARRPNLYGLETHLAAMHRDVAEFQPAGIVVDPMSALMSTGVSGDVHSMVLRLVDFLKERAVTALFINLSSGPADSATAMQISSLMDTWLLLYNRESNGEHNRQLYLLKSRGMAHSNQIREFILSADGIRLRDAYVGPAGVLTGSARLAQEAQDKAAALVREQEMQQRSRNLERKRREINAQIEALRAQLASEVDEDTLLNREGAGRENQLAADRDAMSRSRRVAATPAEPALKAANKSKTRLEKQ